jgi:hypothetical protein
MRSLLAVSLIVTLIVSAQLAATPSRHSKIPTHLAAQLRGGEWCTQHVLAPAPARCQDCESSGDSSEACSTTGTKWLCGNSTNNYCQECWLGQLEDCGGDWWTWEMPGCQGVKHTIPDLCLRQENPYAHSVIGAPGSTCPGNCPGWP